MKRYSLLFLILLSFSFQVKAQKFGYIITDEILPQMPDYKEAMETLNKLSVQWEKEVEGKKKSYLSAKQIFEKEKVLLTKPLQEERQKSLDKRYKDFLDLQNKYFGPNGMLFTKRAELLEPVLEKLTKAIDKVSKKKKLKFLFDKSSDLRIVYVDEAHNYNDYVLQELGIGESEDTLDTKEK